MAARGCTCQSGARMFAPERRMAARHGHWAAFPCAMKACLAPLDLVAGRPGQPSLRRISLRNTMSGHTHCPRSFRLLRRSIPSCRRASCASCPVHRTPAVGSTNPLGRTAMPGPRLSSPCLRAAKQSLQAQRPAHGRSGHSRGAGGSRPGVRRTAAHRPACWLRAAAEHRGEMRCLYECYRLLGLWRCGCSRRRQGAARDALAATSRASRA